MTSLPHAALDRPVAATNAAPRLASLDAFRGLTIAAMLLVNNPGDWDHVYAPLRHAEWHGCTPTDLIFPFFLFIVGAAMSVSTRWRAPDPARPWRPYARVVRRTATLFALGLVLALVPRFDLEHLRIMGVLQRIAACYFIAALVVMHAAPRVRLVVAALLLAIPWALMALVPVPGVDRAQHGPFTLEGNLIGWIDRGVLGGNHLYKRGQFDPEGLLSTLPAAAQVLIGSWVGTQIVRSAPPRATALRLLVIGAVFIAAGWEWGRALPINKQLWTGSYVLLTSGWACAVLAPFHALLDGAGCATARRLARPLQVYGQNAIAAFFGSGMLARLLGMVKVGSPEPVPVMRWYHQHACAALSRDPYVASLLFALSVVALWLAITWAMAARGWFVKV